MTSRDRVAAALHRQPADRVPIFMWFHPCTAEHLAAILDIPQSHVGEAMGNDIRQAWVNNNYAMEGIVHEQEGESHVDAWGIRWEKRGAFNQAVEFPLAGADDTAISAYRFPYDQGEALLSQMDPVVCDRGRFYVGVDVSPCAFEMFWRLRGMEEALLDMALRPSLAETLLDGCADFAVWLSEESCRRHKPDWLWTGDDVAGQWGLMMSPELWRAMIKPRLARVAAVGKARGLPVAYHCCGALKPVIPDLIEIGINVLNPVQCNCPGMDPLQLKAEFGKNLAFMGGVDTQGLLPTGTETDVRRATARLIEGMTSDGGGYILAASHTVPPETPDANIFAMYNEAGHPREAIFDRAADIRARLRLTECCTPHQDPPL